MEVFMAKYGEIALKGLNKRVFEQQLIKNIRRKINHLGRFNYKHAQSTLYITPALAQAPENMTSIDYDEVERRLLTVYGLGAVQRSLILPKNYEEIVKQSIPYLQMNPHFIRARSFRVEARRADKKFPMNSMELMREYGWAVLQAFPNLKVDLHRPDVTIYLEVRDDNAFICANRSTGAGGIPVGCSGKALVLLSGGIDSPVAASMMAKRGLALDMLHFQSPPYTPERALLKVESLCEKLSEYCGEIKLFSVNLTQAQEEIRDTCPSEYMTVLLRRLMMKIASKLCFEKKYSAIITGESVGQVASQTPQAIICTDDAALLPVYRPVIGMDKIEITQIARKIDTFDISTLPYEDCCTVFTPKHPKLKPSLSAIKIIEERLNPDFIENYKENLTVKIFN